MAETVSNQINQPKQQNNVYTHILLSMIEKDMKNEVGRFDAAKCETGVITGKDSVQDPILADRGELIRAEILRRRKLRIQQVREQAKEAAKKIRERYREERENEDKDNREVSVKNRVERTKQIVKELKDAYRTNIQLIGAAHREAAEQPDAVLLQRNAMKEIHKKACARGSEAVNHQKELEAKADKEKKKSIQSRALARAVEDLRSKMVSALPPPKYGHDEKNYGLCASLSEGSLIGNRKSARDVSGTIPDNPPPSLASLGIGESSVPRMRPHLRSFSDCSLTRDDLLGHGKRAAIPLVSREKRPKSRDKSRQDLPRSERSKPNENRNRETFTNKRGMCPEKSSSQNPTVILYDRLTRTEQSYRNPPGLVERVDPSSQPDARTIAAAESGAKHDGVNATNKSKEERAVQARHRGSVAIGRYKAHRDLDKLVTELNAIGRERSKKPPVDVFVPDFKRDQRVKDRQKQLNESFDRLLQLCRLDYCPVPECGDRGASKSSEHTNSQSPLCLNLAQTPISDKTTTTTVRTSSYSILNTGVQTEDVAVNVAPDETETVQGGMPFRKPSPDLLGVSGMRYDEVVIETAPMFPSPAAAEGGVRSDGMIFTSSLLRPRGGAGGTILEQIAGLCQTIAAQQGATDTCTGENVEITPVNVNVVVDGANCAGEKEAETSTESTEYRDLPVKGGKKPGGGCRELLLDHFVNKLLDKKRGPSRSTKGKGNCGCYNKIKIVMVDSSESGGESSSDEDSVCERHRAKRVVKTNRSRNKELEKQLHILRQRCLQDIQALRSEVNEMKATPAEVLPESYPQAEACAPNQSARIAQEMEVEPIGCATSESISPTMRVISPGALALQPVENTICPSVSPTIRTGRLGELALQPLCESGSPTMMAGPSGSDDSSITCTGASDSSSWMSESDGESRDCGMTGGVSRGRKKKKNVQKSEMMRENVANLKANYKPPTLAKREEYLQNAQGMFQERGGELGIPRGKCITKLDLVLDQSSGFYYNPRNNMYYMEQMPSEWDTLNVEGEVNDGTVTGDSFVEHVNALVWDPIERLYFDQETLARYIVQTDQNTDSRRKTM